MSCKSRRTEGVWKIHTIPDVWMEEVKRNKYLHKKPIDIQGELLIAISNEGDVVIDPAAGSFSVMEACPASATVTSSAAKSTAKMEKDSFGYD